MSKPDVNRPTTWIKYRSSLCEGCWAGCCTMPVELNARDLLRMELVSEDEITGSLKRVAKRLSQEGIVRSFRAATGLFILEQKNNGDCIYLNDQRLCTIYDKRPETCRNFPLKGAKPGFCPSSKK